MGAIIIGVAGGSCSGKTSFVKKVHKALGKDRSAIILQDSYYIDQSERFDKDGGAVNFDHPESIEFSLLRDHLRQLKENLAVEVPQYDFRTHKRLSTTTLFKPKDFVLVDGTLLLSQPDIVSLLDLSFFIECDQKTRFKRRLERDVKERGRTPEGVREQFKSQVQPMHEEFLEPSKVNAHHLIDQGDYMRNCKDIVHNLIIEPYSQP